MSFESPGLVAQKLAYQISPIILMGGIAQLLGGALPIVALTQANDFTDGLLSGPNVPNLDGFFASFAPLAGGKMIDIQVATVPFANQAVAANAIIQQPLRISLKMTAPASGESGFNVKTGVMGALQASLLQHTNMGGWFFVATPALSYPNCLLTGITDVSAGQPSQPQSIWQWDFYQPLLQLSQLAGAQNTMMSKISNGTPSDGSLSGSSQAVNPATSANSGPLSDQGTSLGGAGGTGL
jgi:hypothetical protein